MERLFVMRCLPDPLVAQPSCFIFFCLGNKVELHLGNEDFLEGASCVETPLLHAFRKK